MYRFSPEAYQTIDPQCNIVGDLVLGQCRQEDNRFGLPISKAFTRRNVSSLLTNRKKRISNPTRLGLSPSITLRKLKEVARNVALALGESCPGTNGLTNLRSDVVDDGEGSPI